MDMIFDRERLQALALRLQPQYAENAPFPHIVIDDFLSEEIAEIVLGAFPTPEQLKWKKFNADHEVKLQISDETKLNSTVRDVLYQFNSSMLLEFLEDLTGIDGLIADPHFMGGGLHQIQPGGFLDIHADFNIHPRLKLDRRINLLLYLNKEWKDEYNGHLELWDRKMKGCVQRIAPVFNRCVIFTTTDDSYHGHPDVLQCPEWMTRKSMALYYYTNGRPATEGTEVLRTDFKSRPGDAKPPVSRRLRWTMKRFIPPIMIDLLKSARGEKK